MKLLLPLPKEVACSRLKLTIYAKQVASQMGGFFAPKIMSRNPETRPYVKNRTFVDSTASIATRRASERVNPYEIPTQTQPNNDLLQAPITNPVRDSIEGLELWITQLVTMKNSGDINPRRYSAWMQEAKNKLKQMKGGK